MNSIRVILSGGLGNQLFQYATGRALAERTGAELVLDTVTGFKDDKVYNRSYELDVFPGPRACRKTETPSKRAWIWLRLRQRKRIRCIAGGFKIIDEKMHGAELDQLSLHEGENLLIGFWQEERYFESVRDLLRSELALDHQVKRPENEVAVHVRRVQYTRGVGEEYFQAAMGDMRDRIPDVRFHLFTDDPDWGHSFAASQPDMECVSRPEGSAIDDFNRLRSYHHMILANSTFSWWAAWLGEQPGSCMVSPEPDFWSNPNSPPPRWYIPTSNEL